MYISIIILLISSVVLGLIYSTAHRHIVNTYTELVRMKIEETRNQLDNQIRNLQTDLYELSTNTDILAIARYSDFSKQKQINIVMKAEKLILEVLHSNVIASNMYIHYPKEHLVISNGLYPEEKYETLMASEWNKINFWGFSMINRMTQDGSEIYITSELITGKDNGYLAVQINQKTAKSVLEQVRIFKNENIYIFSNDEELLFGIENSRFRFFVNEYNENNRNSGYDIEVLKQAIQSKNNFVYKNGEKYMATYDKSNVSGWIFMHVVPYDEVVKMSNPLRTTVVVLLCISALIGIILSIPVAIKIYEPLKRLCELVQVRFKSREQADRIQYLKNIFNAIFEDNDKLRNLAKQNIPLLREKYLMQIVFQQVKDEKSLKSKLSSLGIKFEGESFRVVVIYIRDFVNTIGTMDYLKIEMYKEYLTENMKDINSFYIVQFEPFKFFVIMNYQDYPVEKLINVFEDIEGGFKYEFGIDIYVGISTEKKDVRLLNQAFIEAIRSYEYQVMIGNKPVGCYEYMGKRIISDRQLSFPFIQDESLQHAIRTCDVEGIERNINEIREFLVKNTPKNIMALKLIINNIYNNIQKLLYELNDYSTETEEKSSEVLSILTKSQSLDELLFVIKDYSTFVSKHYHKVNTQEKKKIIIELKKYMEEHFTEPITVENIASRFYISTSYLHRLFKEELDTTPAEYINQLRIKYAADKLKISTEPIKDIGIECGFETKQAFYRQFKKRFLCTPSQYRSRFKTSQ